jgi:hypothetical protein
MQAIFETFVVSLKTVVTVMVVFIEFLVEIVTLILVKTSLSVLFLCFGRSVGVFGLFGYFILRLVFIG